tara:strand:- start:1004 stop:1600 length:597 start_codon:yes stop_codon:yes gene_type:complete
MGKANSKRNRKRGRPRKDGVREPNGRLRRKAPDLKLVKPSEFAQAQQALYGQDGCDALGRAYRMGLLGTGSDAKTLLDYGRRLAHAYWIAMDTNPITCTLGDRGGSCAAIDHEKVRAREQALMEDLRIVDSMGRPVRRAFDQLVIDPNPDSGPVWLDRLCWIEQQNRGRKPGEYLAQDPADLAQLRSALDGLERLANA